jgi:hypothetical protein
MSRWVALLDANVLYPAPVRDLMLQLAVADVFQAKWSADIHREWIEALLLNEPRRDRRALERTRDLMDTATRDCLVTGYEGLIPALALPDPDDRHVLAAAITGRCEVIVTHNLRDFPEEVLRPFGIEARHPDGFLLDCLDLAPDLFCRGGSHGARAPAASVLFGPGLPRHSGQGGPARDSVGAEVAALDDMIPGAASAVLWAWNRDRAHCHRNPCLDERLPWNRMPPTA